MPIFTIATTSEEVAAAFAEEIKGKNVLITGTSIGGIGYKAAETIARYAALVIITGHNVERLKLSEEALKKEVSGANIRPLLLDLSSFDAVRKAADEVNAYPENIDILINNAASSICPFTLTTDGFEQQMATDHLGPFLFTALILPKIQAARTSTYTPRVVNVSSGAHLWCSGIDLAEVEKPQESTYNGTQAYAKAKSANILAARELTRRAGGQLHAFSVCPGATPTNFVFQNSDARSYFLDSGVISENGKPSANASSLLKEIPQTSSLSWKTISQGTATMLVAAFDPSLNDKPGCHLANAVVANESVAPHSSDM
ncbi:NAD(P)-binding protein, partial [Favolaschia claudopus]